MTPLGIIAGAGPIPLLLAGQCRMQERPCFIAGIRGAASAEIAQFPHQFFGIGEVGGLMRALRQHGCMEVVLIGAVRRPELRHLRLDRGGLRFLPRYLRAAMGGDDRLLRALITEFEHQGFKVVGVHELLADLTAPAGVLGAVQPGPADWTDIWCAQAAARQIGARDIGQGAVVSGGIVLALEAADGTDAMLSRCAVTADTGGRRRGVLVKLPKPGQERRIDLPALGPVTLRLAAAAGLAGIAFEAGGALLVDVAAMIDEADRLGMFLIGLNDAGENP